MKTTNASRLHRRLWGICIAGAIALGLATSAVAQSENTIQVNVGESVTLAVESVAKIAIADPSIGDVVSLSEKEISIIGKKVGTTTLTIVRTEDKPTQIYRIEVGNDAAASMIRRLVASPGINVRLVGDSLVLDGKVQDEIEAQRAAQIAAAYYKEKVVNLLEVEKPRQIKIRTRVAEVNTDAVRNIGFRWFGTAGEVQYALDFTGGGSIIHGLVQPASSGQIPSDPTELDLGADVILQLLLSKNYAKLLSEPTLVTLSGKEASFLVGQEIPIVQQLPQSFTVEFKEVGVRMKVKPTADSQNQIHTVIHAEVSQVIGAGALGIPIIGSKKADSVLQVKDGQTVVIGGLLENNINRDFMRKVPWLGDIPIFGFLFRQKEYGQAQREVLFFMTPEIVKDVDAEVAGAAATPLMREWHGTKANKKVLEVPKKGYDWGLHDPDRLGLPEGRRTRVKPAATEAGEAAAESPAMTEHPVAPAKEPTTNFSPARPAGE